MDKTELYKLLSEHYDLKPDVDWWQHKQSKNWIITHNGVKKISSQPTIQGYTIHPPCSDDIEVFKNGSEGGIFGNEVVMGGDFTLKDKNGDVIRTVFRTGEANSLNVSKHVGYPWAMAEKRMFDRGVLDLLSFAEINVYSEIESEDFNRKNATPVKKEQQKAKQPPQEKTKEVATERAAPPVPAPRPPVPSVRIVPKISAPQENKEEPLEEEQETSNETKGADVLFNLMERNPSDDLRGHTINQLKNLAAENNHEEINVSGIIKYGVEEGFLIRSGEKRGTRYKIIEQVLTKEEKGGLTRKEFDELWAKVTQTVRENNVQYKVLSSSVYAVTNHDTAISAFNSGNLTKEAIEEIERLCILGSNTQERVS